MDMKTILFCDVILVVWSIDTRVLEECKASILGTGEPTLKMEPERSS
jgi:hypothetical protein